MTVAGGGPARRLLVEGVDQEVRGPDDVLPELLLVLGRHAGLAERVVHVAEPAVASRGRDGERRVPHAEPRVATRVGVRRRAAPVLLEEHPEALRGRAEVFLGVQRAQHRVARPRRRRTGSTMPDERLVAADGVVEGLLGGARSPLPVVSGHAPIVASRPTCGGAGATRARGRMGVDQHPYTSPDLGGLMATTRIANAHWEGSLIEGAGKVSLDSSNTRQVRRHLGVPRRGSRTAAPARRSSSPQPTRPASTWRCRTGWPGRPRRRRRSTPGPRSTSCPARASPRSG